MTARGRVLRDSMGPSIPSRAARPPRAVGTRVPRAVVEASERAREIEASARRKALELVKQAEHDAATLRVRVESEARADAAAAVAARAVALEVREARSLEQQRDRVVALARMLAERLLGEQLRVHPDTVTALADQVLAEARGARRARLVAHPDDVELLRAHLASVPCSYVVEVAAGSQKRGELRLESDIGVLDAELSPQLDRLAARLREALET